MFLQCDMYIVYVEKMAKLCMELEAKIRSGIRWKYHEKLINATLRCLF